MLKKTCCFFGHSFVDDKSKMQTRLIEQLKQCIAEAYNRFIIGSHGSFDKLCLSTCIEIKKQYQNIEINLVVTSLSYISKPADEIEYTPPYDICIYDIEEEYYLNRITKSNRRMAEESDLIICCIDYNKGKSGAKTSVNYAKKLGKEIINLYDPKDNRFYGMSKEEKDAELKNFFSRYKK